MHSTLDREYSRARKYLQLTNERLVQAELALRYWQDHDNLYIWAAMIVYTNRTDYRSLEMALIQEWQPKLNYPFICQFFHPKKGILKKTLLNTNSQFGLATLWRRARHKFTPQIVRQTLSSSRFQNRLELWTIIHALGSNTNTRFEQMKMLRSNDGGLTLCYALRRWANNTQESFRTLSLNAIDTTIKWWRGKMAPQNAGTSSSMPHSFLQDSRRCSSKMQLSLIIFANTSRPSVTGLRQTQRFAAASPGHPSVRSLKPFSRPLGPTGLSPPLLASTRTRSGRRRFSFQQSLPVQEGIS